MFRDTLSVSWSYSCYILCCWLAINILIVLAFFSFTALSRTRVGFTQINPAFWCFCWCVYIFQIKVMLLDSYLDLPTSGNLMVKLFSAEWKVGNLYTGLAVIIQAFRDLRC